MKKLIILSLIFIGCHSEKEPSTFDFETIFEKSQGLETATYDETITYFTNLSKAYPEISIDSIGITDAGKPLHIVTLNPDKVFDFSKIRQNKRIILINNGIHPGEPDGIDATMLLFRDIAEGKIKAPKHTVLVTKIGRAHV